MTARHEPPQRWQGRMPALVRARMHCVHAGAASHCADDVAKECDADDLENHRHRHLRGGVLQQEGRGPESEPRARRCASCQHLGSSCT